MQHLVIKSLSGAAAESVFGKREFFFFFLAVVFVVASASF